MDLRDPHFAEPVWLWLTFLGPVVVFALHRWAQWKRRGQLRAFLEPKLAIALSTSHSPRRRLLKQGLLALAVAAIGLALARPQWGQRLEHPESLGEDIVFVVDCSRSMLAVDVAPSRLRKAQFALLDFVERHSRGRVGLVGFSGQAFLVCPLTYDYDAFRESLLALDEKSIPVPGTDLGRALEEAFLAMEKNERRKILVLVTDGEDLEGRGVSQAEALARKGAVVFTVGIGTRGGSSIPVLDERNQPTLLRDAKGQIVHSRLDEETLQTIARVAGGEYHRLGPAGEGLAAIRRLIETPRFGRRFTEARATGVDRFHLLVAAVILLLVAESLLKTRRPRVETATSTTGIAIGLCLLCTNNAARLQAATPPGALTNPPAAAESTNDVAQPSAASLRERFNQAAALLANNRLRDAERAFHDVVATENERFQPPALYNLGHARFRQGQEALREGPDGHQQLARARAAHSRAGRAVEDAAEAMNTPGLEDVVRAYLQGRGARKELRAATEAVRKALENHEAVLLRWQRASGDFKSADELRSDARARHNAAVVDRHIARLVDMNAALQAAIQSMQMQMQDLRRRMEQLKGRMPAELLKELGNEPDEGEDQSDGDGDKPPPEPEPGTGEKEQEDGRRMGMSYEEAARLLESLRLDAQRKLPMGARETATPESRKGRDW